MHFKGAGQVHEIWRVFSLIFGESMTIHDHEIANLLECKTVGMKSHESKR